MKVRRVGEERKACKRSAATVEQLIGEKSRQSGWFERRAVEQRCVFLCARWVRFEEELSRVLSSLSEIQGCCGGIETKETRLSRRGEEERRIGQRCSIREEKKRRASSLSPNIGQKTKNAFRFIDIVEREWWGFVHHRGPLLNPKYFVTVNHIRSPSQ